MKERKQIHVRARKYMVGPDMWEIEREVLYRDRWSGSVGYHPTNIGHVERTAAGRYHASISLSKMGDFDTLEGAVTKLVATDLSAEHDHIQCSRQWERDGHTYYRFRSIGGRKQKFSTSVT